MKKLLLFVVLITLSALAQAQTKIGLGIKLGDPTAISAKIYTGKKIAFEVNLGTSPYSYGNGYYDKYYGNNGKHNGWVYDGGYGHGGGACLQARILAHKDIKADIDGKLQWYAGGGLQYRQRTYYGNFWDNNGYYYHHYKLTDNQFGIDAIIGAEYTFDNAPVSIFADLNLFMQVVDNVYPWIQGGIGA